MKIFSIKNSGYLLIIFSLAFLNYSCQSDGGVWLGEGDGKGKSYTFGPNKEIATLQGLAKAYSEQNVEELFKFYADDYLTERRQKFTKDWLGSMESISMEPYRIIPLHQKDGDFKQILAWSKEERVYKNGSYQKLDLMEQFIMDDEGKVRGFKQWQAIDSVNFGQSFGGKFIGRNKGDYSGRSFVFSNRNETAIIEQMISDYNDMNSEAMRVAFADEFTINDYKGKKTQYKNEQISRFFTPYKSVNWEAFAIVPIKIRGTDAASGVMVHGRESRVYRNGRKWEKDLMEIYYFDLEGKISSMIQFAKP